MSRTVEYYFHAELAFAAYATLVRGVNPIPALRDPAVGLSATPAARFAERWYNFGRVVTYSLLGLLFGFIGKGFALWDAQRWVSVILGALILIYIFLPVNFKRSFLNISIFLYATNYLKKLFGKAIQRKSKSSHFLIGLLNGLLPCGFVYVGLFASLALGDAVQGMLFMMLFSIGTIPAMLGTAFGVNFISLRLKQRINLLIPVFASILAAIQYLPSLYGKNAHWR